MNTTSKEVKRENFQKRAKGKKKVGATSEEERR